MLRAWRKATGGSARRSSENTDQGLGLWATLHRMKSLIAIVLAAIIGAIVYKVLTTEVPIDES